MESGYQKLKNKLETLQQWTLVAFNKLNFEAPHSIPAVEETKKILFEAWRDSMK